MERDRSAAVIEEASSPDPYEWSEYVGGVRGSIARWLYRVADQIIDRRASRADTPEEARRLADAIMEDLSDVGSSR